MAHSWNVYHASCAENITFPALELGENLHSGDLKDRIQFCSPGWNCDLSYTFFVRLKYLPV
jgi:hypothetical protein